MRFKLNDVSADGLMILSLYDEDHQYLLGIGAIVLRYDCTANTVHGRSRPAKSLSSVGTTVSRCVIVRPTPFRFVVIGREL